MKKTVLLFIAALAVFTSFSSVQLTSQKVEEANVYYVNVQILKIFAHPKGYYVIYKKSGLKHDEVFIPHSWLSPSDGRGKMELVNGRINPYLSFYIKDGKFDYIKIAAPKDLTSPIWGTLQSPANYDANFEGVETLELKF